jgi:hypothetical protein
MKLLDYIIEKLSLKCPASLPVSRASEEICGHGIKSSCLSLQICLNIYCFESSSTYDSKDLLKCALICIYAAKANAECFHPFMLSWLRNYTDQCILRRFTTNFVKNSKCVDTLWQLTFESAIDLIFKWEMVALKDLVDASDLTWIVPDIIPLIICDSTGSIGTLKRLLKSAAKRPLSLKKSTECTSLIQDGYFVEMSDSKIHGMIMNNIDVAKAYLQQNYSPALIRSILNHNRAYSQFIDVMNSIRSLMNEDILAVFISKYCDLISLAEDDGLAIVFLIFLQRLYKEGTVPDITRLEMETFCVRLFHLKQATNLYKAIKNKTQ